MGLAAFGAFNPANPEKMFSVREDDPPRVVTVDRKAGRMPAGASQLMKLEAVNNGFVIILRKLILIFDRNEYHCLAWHGWRQPCGCKTAGGLCEGRGLLSFLRHR